MHNNKVRGFINVKSIKKRNGIFSFIRMYKISYVLIFIKVDSLFIFYFFFLVTHVLLVVSFFVFVTVSNGQFFTKIGSNSIPRMGRRSDTKSNISNLVVRRKNNFFNTFLKVIFQIDLCFSLIVSLYNLCSINKIN